MKQVASERYQKLTGKKYVYNITPVANIPSIMKNGLMCYDMANRLQHESIALNEVQARRDQVTLPNDMRLHQYANMYFSYWNPMLYRRRDQAETICILAVRAAVMDIDGCILTDRNAAARIVRFYQPLDGLNELNFERIHARSWVDADLYKMHDNKAVKCAEILVPKCVPPCYIDSACVVNEAVKETLKTMGFDKKIYVDQTQFFR